MNFTKGDEILKALDSLSTARLPERIFKGYFLPLFTCEEDNPAKLAEWIAVAGSPFNIVDIFDEAGNVVLTIPPILDNRSVNPSKLDGLSFAHIMTTYGQYSRQSPVLGERYLRKTLGDQVEAIGEVKDGAWSEKLWAKVFDRYGVKVKGVNDTPSQEQSASGETTNDDLDFNPI